MVTTQGNSPIPSCGAGYVSPKDGDYARAEALGLRVVLMLVETFGGLGPALVEELRKGAEWRANKLTASRVRRDDVVGADVHGVHDAAPLGGGAVLGRAGGGRGARPIGGGRPTSGALDGRRGA
eukprot:scaffold8453_cov80-Phaeocystis_antarctica.AAC.1